MGLKRFAWVALGLLLPASAFAGEGKLSGEAFGDLYWVAASHDSALVDQNGTWFRRMNLSYDYKYDETFSSRVRMEAASPGDFLTKATLTPFMKDLWIKGQKGNHAALVGLSQVPMVSLIEEVWGLRPIEKVPDELQRFGSSRDMGVAVTGAFGEGKKLGYHVMGGNGSALQGETDSKKKVMGAIRFWVTPEFVVEVYGDYEDRDLDGDRKTGHAFAGYKAKKMRAGVEYVEQKRSAVGEDVDIRIASGFITGAVSEKMWLYGRVDRTMDPNPEASKIVYLPMDPSVATTFVLAGFEYRVTEGVTFSPNVEIVVYDAPEDNSPTPDTDVMPRFTFACKF